MGNRRKKKGRVRWIKHYNSAQKILLVGEGDFSFSACLARAFGSASNMVATCLHSQELLMEKHWSSEGHVDELKRLGCQILHDVDVHEMSRHPTLKHMKFDVVVFNFPHAGHFEGYGERDKDLIKMHKELLKAFFKSAGKMLKEGGEVHVTHRDDYPYNTWGVVKLASKSSGLNLKEKVKFEKWDYQGYHNKRGGNINCNKTFPLKDQCFTFKFSLMENNTPVLQDNERDQEIKKIVNCYMEGIRAAVEHLHV